MPLFSYTFFLQHMLALGTPKVMFGETAVVDLLSGDFRRDFFDSAGSTPGPVEAGGRGKSRR